MDKPVDIKKLIHSILLRMKYGGCNPFSNSVFAKYFARCLISMNLCTFLLQTIFLSRFSSNYKDISVLVLDVIGYSATWQINCKLYTCHIKKKILLSLYKKIDTEFWPLDDSFTPKQTNTVNQMYKLTRIISKIYATSIFCTLYGYCITCPFRNEHHLVNNIWVPGFIEENRIYLIIILVVQFLAMSVSTFAGLLSFDQFFLVSIASAIGQLKMIRYKLLTIGDTNKKSESNYDIVIKCVNHHNLLYSFIDEIESLSSVAVLHMLGTNIVLGVIVLFVFLIEENISQLIAYVSIMISVIGQFYMYCLLGQFIQTETMSVADAAYGASWENIPDHNVRMGILLIIQRSHKYAKITMGGFLILCLENFTRVARMMLSMLTLIVNMRNE